MANVIEMKLDSVKKHSVRYNAATEEDAKVLVSIYIMKTAFPDTTYPAKIEVSIKEVN